MKKIIAFGAINSKTSINKQFAAWAANQIDNIELQVLDLNDFEMPIYSMEREMEIGIPQLAKDFKQLINDSDSVVISFAEHNGSYSTAFKNIFDWISRLGKPIWSDKSMFLLATSPGPRGGMMVLENATRSFPYQGGKVSASSSLGSFGQNFSTNEGITSEDKLVHFNIELEKFSTSL